MAHAQNHHKESVIDRYHKNQQRREYADIVRQVARGERVELRGFGAFTVKRRNARTGRNPRTGEAVPVDEKAVPFFKAGKELRDRVNRGARGSRG